MSHLADAARGAGDAVQVHRLDRIYNRSPWPHGQYLLQYQLRIANAPGSGVQHALYLVSSLHLVPVE